MKHQLKRLFEYNLWANQKLLDVLLASDFKHPKISIFISHVLNAQLIWFDRVNGSVSNTPVWETYDLEKVSTMLISNSQDWLDLIDTAEALDSVVKYTDSKGKGYETVLSDILTHVANHGTHHRGQVALLLREEGIAPPASDFIFFSRD